jgi:hypothetical protein
MNFKEDIILGFEALKLNREATKKIIGKTDNGWSITFIIALSAGLSALLSAIFAIADTFSGEPSGYITVIPTIIFAPIAFIIGTSLIHLGAKILGGKGKGMDMYKGLGSMSIIQVVSWVPFLNILAMIWGFVAEVVAISEIHQFSKWRAFFAMLIVGIILGAIVGVIAFAVGLGYLLSPENIIPA